MTVDPRTDEGLMLAYQAGEVAAFEALYPRYRSRLYRYLVHQCGDARLADELYQDIWLRVVNARADYAPLAKFSTWLFRIAHHRLIDHYRHHARDKMLLWEDAGEENAIENFPAPAELTPSAQLERLQLRQRIGAALAGLPEPQREVFLLAEAGGMSLEEIASATGTGRETVKSRLRYALSKLRHSLKDLL
jgi:RNA polymerase sigma-70 factor (ECF subfamily)